MARRQQADMNPIVRDYVGPVNLGFYADRSALFIPKGGLQDCLNVRIRRGALTNDLIGWSQFDAVQLDGEVTLCDSFLSSAGFTTVFGTREWLYRYSALVGPQYLNPRYITGTASRAGVNVTGVGTLWNDGGVSPGHATWARNIEPGDFIHFGAAGQTDQGAVWHEIATVTGNTTLTTVTSGAVVAGPYTIRKAFSGLADEVWQWALFPRRDADGFDYWLGTNSAQFCQWDVSGDEVTVFTTLDFVPRGLTIDHRIVICFDCTDTTTGDRDPGRVRTSAIGDPLNYTTLEAIDAFATDGEETIWQARTLGDFVALYCQESVRLMSFVGEGVVWVFRTALPGIGIVGRNALMDFGDHHEFLSSDTLYMFDGVQSISHAPQAFRDAIRAIDYARIGFQTIAFADEENGEVTWILPLVSDVAGPEIGLVEHYLEHHPSTSIPLMPFTKRQIPATAVGRFVADQAKRFSDFAERFNEVGAARFNDRAFGGQYPTLLFGGPDGIIHQLNEGKTANGLPLSCFAEFAMRPVYESGDHAGIIKRIEPGVDLVGTGDLFIEILKYDRVGAQPELIASLPYDLSGAGERFVSPRKTACYAAVRFRSTGSEVWALEAWAWNVARASGR